MTPTQAKETPRPDPGPAGGPPLPLYRQVQRYILGLIESRERGPGEAIPSESQLVETLRVSRMTVNRAVRELAAQGLLTRLQGVGTFVARQEPDFALLEIRDIAEEIAARGGSYKAELVLHQEEEAPRRVAAGLGLEPGAPVFHSLLVHQDGPQPVQVEDRIVSESENNSYLYS